MFGLDMAQSCSPYPGLTKHKLAKPKLAEKVAAAPEGKRNPRKQAAVTQRRKQSSGARKSATGGGIEMLVGSRTGAVAFSGPAYMLFP